MADKCAVKWRHHNARKLIFKDRFLIMHATRNIRVNDIKLRRWMTKFSLWPFLIDGCVVFWKLCVITENKINPLNLLLTKAKGTPTSRATSGFAVTI